MQLLPTLNSNNHRLLLPHPWPIRNKTPKLRLLTHREIINGQIPNLHPPLKMIITFLQNNPNLLQLHPIRLILGLKPNGQLIHRNPNLLVLYLLFDLTSLLAVGQPK